MCKKIQHILRDFGDILPNISSIECGYNFSSIIHELHGHEKSRKAFSFIVAQPKKKWQPKTSKKPFGQRVGGLIFINMLFILF